jgi:hypothetical protein
MNPTHDTVCNMIEDLTAGWDCQSHEIVDIYLDEIPERVEITVGGGR